MFDGLAGTPKIECVIKLNFGIIRKRITKIMAETACQEENTVANATITGERK
jgi:hypothetical protein